MKRFIIFLIFISVLALSQDIQEDFVQEIYQQPQAVPEEPASPQQQAQTSKSTAEPQPRQFFGAGPFFTVQKLKTYRFQMVGLVAILFYVVCYLRGKRANAELIDAFYQQTQGYFNQNFAHIGFTKQSNEEPFIGESANEVIFYASGRTNIQCMQINFSMRKRQDLISLFVYELIWPEKDMITIDIPVKTDIPLVFLLSLKKKIKSYLEKHLDARMLTGSFEVKNLHQNYEVLGQSADSVDQIFDGYVVKRITENPGLFMFMHYTDQKMFSNNTGHLRVVLNGAYKDRAKYLTAIELIFHIVDKIATMKLSQNSKAKAFQARQVYNSSKEKAALEAHRQELRKQKQEKLRKEQAWLKSLPPEKQKREDEKRKRKEFNKMLKGKSMKVM